MEKAVCTHDGHVEFEPEGQYCPRHGTPLLTRCPKCSQPWKIVNVSMIHDVGSDFCIHCAHPGPWVSREKRLAGSRADCISRVSTRPPNLNSAKRLTGSTTWTPAILEPSLRGKS